MTYSSARDKKQKFYDCVDEASLFLGLVSVKLNYSILYETQKTEGQGISVNRSYMSDGDIRKQTSAAFSMIRKQSAAVSSRKVSISARPEESSPVYVTAIQPACTSIYVEYEGRYFLCQLCFGVDCNLVVNILSSSDQQSFGCCTHTFALDVGLQSEQWIYAPWVQLQDKAVFSTRPDISSSMLA
jgi:hypothetical protein